MLSDATQGYLLTTRNYSIPPGHISDNSCTTDWEHETNGSFVSATYNGHDMTMERHVMTIFFCPVGDHRPREQARVNRLVHARDDALEILAFRAGNFPRVIKVGTALFEYL